MRFILAFLSSVFDHIQSISTGAAIPGIAREQILSLSVPLPPLPEQQRIVRILDEAFASIATAKANTEKNLQNARALFESHLRDIFGRVWKSCELVPLSQVATYITDGDHLPPPKSETGVPFITIGNVDKRFQADAPRVLPHCAERRSQEPQHREGSTLLRRPGSDTSGIPPDS